MKTRVVAALVYTHRWLGIAGRVLFAVWFVSGVAMMYARMPRLSAEERLSRAAMLDLDRARVDPSAVAAALSQPPQRLRVGMLGDRPVYRFQTGAVLDDRVRGQRRPAHGLDRRCRAGRRPTVRARLRDDDAGGGAGHRARSVDAAAARVAACAQDRVRRRRRHQSLRVRADGRTDSGDDATGRWLGFVGAVLHWIYFTPIRTHGELWNQLIIWTSIAGTMLCLTGLVWGVWRFSTASRYHLRGIPHAHSPYVGMLKWHHYTGLVFGAFTLTWVFSGLLSMDPWDWSPSTAPTRAQRDALSGGPIRWNRTHPAIACAWRRWRSRPRCRSRRSRSCSFVASSSPKRFALPEPSTRCRFPLGDPGAVIAPRIALRHALVRVARP